MIDLFRIRKYLCIHFKFIETTFIMYYLFFKNSFILDTMSYNSDFERVSYIKISKTKPSTSVSFSLPCLSWNEILMYWSKSVFYCWLQRFANLPIKSYWLIVLFRSSVYFIILYITILVREMLFLTVLENIDFFYSTTYFL